MILFTIALKNSSTSVQFSSVAQSCPTLWDPMDCSTQGFPVPHQLLELAQSHVHQVSDAIQPSHPLSSPSPPALNLSQHQGLFQWVSSLHQVAKVLELQLQHQSFQWIFRTVWITRNCRKFCKRWEYKTTWSASLEICMQVRKQQIELDMEEQSGSK